MKRRRLTILAAFVVAAGCRKPTVDVPRPILAGCGPLPPLPTLCLETLPPDAGDGATLVCYADAAAALIAELRATRAQFAPCAFAQPPVTP